MFQSYSFLSHSTYLISKRLETYTLAFLCKKYTPTMFQGYSFLPHYRRKGCFKYSPSEKNLNNDLFRRFSVRNTCLLSKILLERHVFLTKNLLKRLLLKIFSLGLYLKQTLSLLVPSIPLILFQNAWKNKL